MFGAGLSEKTVCKYEMEALQETFAIASFSLDGVILEVNPLFCDLLGYSQEDICGKKHNFLMDKTQAPVYHALWDALHEGRPQKGKFCYSGAGGKEVWVDASYNPVCDKHNRLFKVLVIATDITQSQHNYADLLGQVNAIRRSQAVIAFDLKGNILDANDNFLNALGYTLNEIQGRHHSMFVEPEYRNSSEYHNFWRMLGQGEFQAGQYKRLGKNNKEVWIEATYNPIYDQSGRLVKVVKYASDINHQIALLKNLKQLIDNNFSEIDHAIHKSADQASGTVNAVANASDNIQTVASSAEELAASIREIADTMSRTNSATDTAYHQTEAADMATQKLSDAARAMGGIIELIQNIAGQINLLALNATIESARAGEAGRGFAVVASEVKNLAAQARDATDRIAREIEGVQNISGEVVQALGIIASSINTVREYVAGTASAVEEQSCVTDGISSSMQAAVQAISTIQHNTSDISSSVSQVAEVVGKTKDAARVLAR